MIIDAGLENFTRVPNQRFSPDDAPEGLTEDALTKCVLESSCLVRQGDVDLNIDGCRGDARISTIEFSLSASATVFLPDSGHPVLESHEEGHVEICRAIFERSAERAIGEALPFIEATFVVEDLDRCRTETMRQQAQKKIDEMCGRFGEKVQTRLMRRLQEASNQYDRLTHNGRRDKSGRSTVLGQRAAARTVLKRAERNP